MSHGSTTTFTVTSSTGYTRNSVSGDAAGGSWSGNTYTTAGNPNPQSQLQLPTAPGEVDAYEQDDSAGAAKVISDGETQKSHH